MKFYRLITIIFILSLIQCKKNEITPENPVLETKITAIINNKTIKVDNIILLNEIDGLRLYLIIDNKLISIYTNKYKLGTYHLYSENNPNTEKYSRGEIYEDTEGGSVTSLDFEITSNSNNYFSGNFNCSISPWYPNIDISCNFENVKITDVRDVIIGTYRGLRTNTPHPEMFVYRDYNSKATISKTNNNKVNIVIKSNDGAFEDFNYFNHYILYLIHQEIDKNTSETIFKKDIEICDYIEGSPISLIEHKGEIHFNEPLNLSLSEGGNFQKE